MQSRQLDFPPSHDSVLDCRQGASDPHLTKLDAVRLQLSGLHHNLKPESIQVQLFNSNRCYEMIQTGDKIAARSNLVF